MINIFRDENYFLSNFYPCLVVKDNIKYPSVEHYYVAMKTNAPIITHENKKYRLNDFRKMISELKYPGMVKKIGKKIPIREDWDTEKINIMKYGIREKFKDSNLKNKLINTKNEELVEGNWWHDNYFGNCFCDNCKNKKGKNKLGKLIMEIRDEINDNKKGGLEEIFF